MNTEDAVSTINMAIYNASIWFVDRGEIQLYQKTCDLMEVGPSPGDTSVSDDFVRFHLELLASWLLTAPRDQLSFQMLFVFHSATKDAIRSLHKTCFR